MAKMLKQALPTICGIPKVLVTHPNVPQEAIDLLKQKCEVIVCQNDPSIRSDILKKCKGVNGLLWADITPLNAEVLNAAGLQLKSISTVSVGVDHVDVSEVMRRKIALGHMAMVLDKPVADLAIGLMISAARRFHEGRRCIEMSSWRNWRFMWMLGQEIRGAKVGFFGFGQIAQAIAKRLAQFEIGSIIYNTRTPSAAADTYNAKHVTFDELLRESDILFIVSPLTEQTKGKFDENAFNKMKSNAVLVNVARGQIIDQKVLYNALKSNKIFAAGLDVMTPEPLPADDPLLSLPNCVLTPHFGPDTLRTQRDMAIFAAHNILLGLAGEPMLAPVHEL